jgi:hypothetical protein
MAYNTQNQLLLSREISEEEIVIFYHMLTSPGRHRIQTPHYTISQSLLYLFLQTMPMQVQSVAYIKIIKGLPAITINDGYFMDISTVIDGKWHKQLEEYFLEHAFKIDLLWMEIYPQDCQKNWFIALQQKIINKYLYQIPQLQLELHCR